MTVVGMGEANQALESAVRKLSKAVIPESATSLAVDILDESAHVTSLKEAAATNKVVHIVYRSVGKEEITERDIEPWTVFATMGRWYVKGYCRLVGEERTFRVDRIRSVEPLDDEIRTALLSIPEPGVGYTASDDDVICTIDLYPRAKWVLEYYPVEVKRETSKATRIRFSAPDAEVPARLLLRLGEEARLVAGPEVSERVRELGSRLLDRYQ